MVTEALCACYVLHMSPGHSPAALRAAIIAATDPDISSLSLASRGIFVRTRNPSLSMEIPDTSVSVCNPGHGRRKEMLRAKGK